MSDKQAIMTSNPKLKFQDFPHLIEMEKKIKAITYGTKEYWEQRCVNLEKSIDPTYTDFERSNCDRFYRILINKS